MESRSRGAVVLCLALFGALLPFPGAAAECPPLDAQTESVWGLRAENWDKACADGRDLDQYLRQVKAEFSIDCAGRFPSLPKELVIQECLQGVPGRERLQALLGGGPAAGPTGSGATRMALQSRPAAGLQKLEAEGLDAGSLDGFYTGSAALPVLQTGFVARAGPAAEPRVELGRSVIIDPKLSKDEASFARSILERMQGCSEGRAILSGLVTEGKARKTSFKVTFKDYPDTVIVRKGDIEDLKGGEYGEASTEDRALYLNRALLKFRSRESAIDNTVGTAAHEMTHLWRAARVKRTMPHYYEVFDMDLGDEFGARLKGQLVGAQTHRGTATVDTEDARDMLSDPDNYRERMKLWSPVYAVSLDLSEMQDPRAAYAARLKALKTSLEDLKRGQKEQPLVLKRIGHFCKAHKEDDYCGRFSELEAETRANIKTYPHDIQEAESAMKQVADQLAMLETQDGKRLMKLLKRAAADSKYRTLRQEDQDDLARLRAEAAKRPLPKPKKTPGQIDREGLDALAAGDKEHAQELE
ncbi:MAG: hypothetical protein HY926_15155 [Elusimicrobia bacterium]|nr:hypothetical protein [Elusimicrobiota bacterium]